MNKNLPAPQTTICKECHMGVLRLRRATYLESVGADFICMPHVPIWICDICGYCVYDERALQRLDRVLGRDPTIASRKRSYRARHQAENRPSTLES